MNSKHFQWPHFGWKASALILAILFVAAWADSGSLFTGLLFLVGYVLFCLFVNVLVGFCIGFWQSVRQ